MMETVKRVGRKRVPAPVVFFVIVAVLVASVMLTGIGRELWGVFFPPGDQSAVLQEDLFEGETSPPAPPEPVVQNPAPATDGMATAADGAAEPAGGTAEVEAVPTPAGDWTIQAASFRTEAGAQRALGLMASATGLTGRIVPGTGDSAGWFRVYVGSFPTRAAASAKSVELLDAGLIPEDSFPARHNP
jgi:cell division septation protein DedD